MTDLSQLSDAQLQQLLASSNITQVPPPVQPVSATTLPPIPGARSAEQGVTPDGRLQWSDPSKLTDEQLQAAAANSDPNMSTAEDMGRSGVTGAEKAGTGLLGSIGDFENLWGHGVDWLADKALGLPHRSMDYAHYNGHATSADFDKTVQDIAGPYHVPQTTAGRYTERLTEFSPAALTGSGLGRLGAVVLPALGSQAAEDAAPDGWKPAASFLGALLGGGVNGGLERFGRAPQAAFGAAMPNVTPEQMALAQALRQDAAGRGLQLTVPEAVQQVTNNGTGLGRLQRVVESTKQGQQLTAPYFAERPSQVQGAVTRFADTIAPPTAQPGMVGQRANVAATGALDQARQVVNGVANPDYAALVGQEMDPEQYAALAQNPSYAASLADLRNHPELGAAVANLPDNNLSVINEVQKRLATGADAARGSPLLPGDNHLAALRTEARLLADALARDASDLGYGGEYGRARDTVANLSQQYVDPLKAGPLGKLSKTEQVGEQTAALYPGIPLEGAPAETTAAVRVLGNTAPGVAEDLTRQHIMNNLNESLSSLQGGQNQYAGAKLAVALAGNPEQAATLRAGVSALPGIQWIRDAETGVTGPVATGDIHARNLDGLLQALEATGKRQPPGSMTAFNEADLKDLHIAPFAQAIGRLGDPLTWGAGIGDVINRANYRRNVDALAKMLMAPPEETEATLQRARRAARPATNPILPALVAGPGAEANR